MSWYEAAAYAAFTGKSLPTFYHWYRAADFGRYILNVSNFDERGPAPVGRYRGLGSFGTSDMAGNVKEWCWNAVPDHRRFLLGGAWSDAKYMFAESDARGPFERAPTYGFRLLKYNHSFFPAGDGFIVRSGPILVALEPRLKASVLQSTGIGGERPPELDSVNYAPRVRIPTLMLNGRYDFEFAVETAQRPLFDLLGTRSKKHRVFEAGHKSVDSALPQFLNPDVPDGDLRRRLDLDADLT